MTKADVLSDFSNIEVCTSYSMDDKSTTELPFDHADPRIKTNYTAQPGWMTELNANEALPKELEDYIDFIEKETECPISIVSLGPDRTQTMVRDLQLA